MPLTLGNLRDFAARNEAFNVGRIQDGSLEREPTTAGATFFKTITTPFRWLGRSIAWLFGSGEKEEAVAAGREVREALVREYGQDLVDRLGGGIGGSNEQPKAVTSWQLKTVLDRFDADTRQNHRLNRVAARQYTTERLEELEVPPNLRAPIQEEVRYLMQSYPAMRQELEGGDLREIVERITDSAVQRRQILAGGHLRELQRLLPLRPAISAKRGVEQATRLATSALDRLFEDDHTLRNACQTQMQRAANLMDRMTRLLESLPLDDLERVRGEVEQLGHLYESVMKELQEVKEALQEQLHQLPISPESEQASRTLRQVDAIVAALVNDLHSTATAVEGHLREIEAMTESHPLSADELQHALEVQDRAAIVTIDRWLDKLEHDESTPLLRRDQLRDLRGTILNRIETHNYGPVFGGREGPFSVDETNALLKRHEGNLAVDITALLSGERPGDFDVEEIGLLLRVMHQMEEALPQIRNTRREDWQTVRHDFDAEIGGQSLHVRSEVIPAGRTGVLTEAYAHTGTVGVCSDDSGLTAHGRLHATNLAVSRLDLQGRNVLTMIRHGTFHARKFKPEKLSPQVLARLKQDLHQAPTASHDDVRKAVDDHRVMEGVTLALQNQPQVLNTALDREEDEEIPTLHILSTNLQTGADTFEDKDGTGLEGGMINRQTAAFDRVGSRVQTVEVIDPRTREPKRVQVRVKIIPVNFPVNPGATGDLGFLPGVHVGERRAKQSVHDALQFLTGSHKTLDPIGGMAADFLARDDIPEWDKDQMRALINDCRDIAAGDHMTSPDGKPDIYGLAARMNLLASRLGIIPMFNCKSGKDRTGQLDLETKFLAAQYFGRAFLPGVGVVKARDRAAYGLFALKTGNLEIQRYNVGLAGYKTINQQKVLDRIPESARSRFAGGAKLVEH